MRPTGPRARSRASRERARSTTRDRRRGLRKPLRRAPSRRYASAAVRRQGRMLRPAPTPARDRSRFGRPRCSPGRRAVLLRGRRRRRRAAPAPSRGSGAAAGQPSRRLSPSVDEGGKGRRGEFRLRDEPARAARLDPAPVVVRLPRRDQHDRRSAVGRQRRRDGEAVFVRELDVEQYGVGRVCGDGRARLRRVRPLRRRRRNPLPRAALARLRETAGDRRRSAHACASHNRRTVCPRGLQGFPWSDDSQRLTAPVSVWTVKLLESSSAPSPCRPA